VHWDDENEFGERVWMGLEIESVATALWMMTGVGPLPKLTLLEAESDSLVQMRLKICSLNCCKNNELLIFFVDLSGFGRQK
jgi:hypothetical protein